jgi:hypothetical protein
MTSIPSAGRGAGLVLLLAGSLALAACGGALGADSDEIAESATVESGPTASSFAISTSTLPGGGVGEDYPATALRAVGATAPVEWTVSSGALPPGMSLSETGVVAGRPTSSGTFAFVVRASAGTSEATRALQIPVGVLALVAEDLPCNVAWAERPVTLAAQGASGAVTFRALANGSAGRWLTTNATTGRATWAPGRTVGAGVVDRLEAEDATGRRAQVSFSVMPDPFAHHVAEFGSSDVWFVDTSRKFGSHGFATDFHQGLSVLGLRSPSSKDATGTLADRLAVLAARRHILRELNVRFGRDADGRIGDGLPITFPDALPAGYERPVAGSFLSGGTQRYSVIGIHSSITSPALGMAFVDVSTNDLHENNTTHAGGELGVFVNHTVGALNGVYGDDLARQPIDDGDVAALESLLYDLPSYGARADLVRRTLRAFAKTMAELCAHEIGHSLSLAHTNPYVAGSLMNSGVFISDAASTFLPVDMERLRRALPGTGRMGGVSKPLSMPDGVDACALRLANVPARRVPVWAVPAR